MKYAITFVNILIMVSFLAAIGCSPATKVESVPKPAAVVDKIIEGKLGSFYEQVCLLDQPSIRDPKLTVGQLVQQAIAKMGENISVPRFVRFKLGESA